MAEGVQTYRMLIRAIHKNIGSQSGSRLWINHVREEFKRNRPSVTVEDQTELLQHARDYAFLINGVRYQKELLLSYNVGIPVEQREKKMNERAAALVGLAMPKKEQA